MTATPAADAPRRLYERLREAPGAEPAARAFAFAGAQGEERTWTREALFARATEVAAGLRRAWEAAGAPDGAVAAILTGSQEEQVVHYLAALEAGLVPAILTPPNRKLHREVFLETIVGVLERVAPALVVSDLGDDLADAAARGGAAPLPTLVAPGAAADAVPGALTPRRVADGIAFVQFSSGTTGIKKGVGVRFEAVRDQLEAYGRAIGIGAEDRIASWLPLYHDMGFITALHLPLAHAVPCWMLQPLDWVARPASYLQLAGRVGATLGWHPNFAYAFMAARVRDGALEGVDLGTLRGLANCGEPVTSAAQGAFAQRFAGHGLRPGTLWGCYAMAETTFAVTHGVATDVEGADPVGPRDSPALAPRLPLITVGAPLDGVELEVRDAAGAGTVLGDGTLGELWIRAPFLAAGYLADPEASAAAFAGGWYRTGDLGYRRDGRFYVTGRVKDMLVVAGENVFPEDVEAIVGAAAGIRAGRVAAFAVFDDRLGTERVVVLAEREAAEDDAFDLVALRQRLMAELQLAQVTVHPVAPEWLVKSSSGKMARAASAARWMADRAVEGAA